MKTKFIEAHNGPRNWGKFAVCRFNSEEWLRPSTISERRPLLSSQGWTPTHVWVLDLATGEGAFFGPWGSASADLNKHQVWVCPLFEPFLTWLYQQDLTDLDALPTVVELPDAEFAMSGYRRPGPTK